MKVKRKYNPLIFHIFEVVSMLQWITMLKFTDGYFIGYALVFTCSLWSLIYFWNNNVTYKYNSHILSGFFSLLVTAAEYKIWTEKIIKEDYSGAIRWIYVILMAVLLFLGGYIVFNNIIRYISDNICKILFKKENRFENNRSKWIYLTTFFAIVVVDMIVVFTSLYPGVLISDSIDQMGQIMSGVYTNDHPFWQTILIKPFVMAGLAIFGDINAGVAVYTIFQIIMLAAVISFTLMTLYQNGVSTKILYVIGLVYIFLPYNMMFRINLWKDTVFSGCVLMFVVAGFRILNENGKKKLNYILMILSGVGVCLFRNNGFIAFVICFLICFFLLWKINKKMLLTMASILVIGTIMKHSCLKALGVDSTNSIFALSIPVQQISRVIVDNGELSDDDIERISSVVDMDYIKEKYDPQTALPILYNLTSNRADCVINQSRYEFLKTYINIGLKNPGLYVKSWIDQTKGFWNCGYPYWVWAYTVDENDLGLYSVAHVEIALYALRSYCSAFYNISVLQIFLCIGFHVWLTVLVLYISLIRKKKEVAFITVLPLSVVVTLLLGTHIFNEFRYAYAVFCVLPFAICVALLEDTKVSKG